MAEELVIRRWCDRCAERGQETPATHLVISAIAVVEHSSNTTPTRTATRPPYRLGDACEPCAKEIESEGFWLAERGRYATAEPSSYKPTFERTPAPLMECTLCGLQLVRSSLIGHLVTQHGATRPVQPDACPDCGIAYDTAQAMGVHRRKAHGYDAVTEIMAALQRAAPGRRRATAK